MNAECPPRSTAGLPPHRLTALLLALFVALPPAAAGTSRPSKPAASQPGGKTAKPAKAPRAGPAGQGDRATVAGPSRAAREAARAAARDARQARLARGQSLRHAIIEKQPPARRPVRRITLDPAAVADPPSGGAGWPASPRPPSRAATGKRPPAAPVIEDDEPLGARWLPETSSLPQLGERAALDLSLRPGRHVDPRLLAADGRAGSVPGASTPPAPLNAGFGQMQALLRQAAERSATIRDAQANVRASEQDIREASGARLPQVSMDVTSRYTSGAGDNQTSSQRGAPYYSVTGTMSLYDFGRIRNIVDSRSASRRAADARLDSALESLATDTAIAALEVGRWRLSLATAESYLRNVSRLAAMLVEITREDPGRSGELTQARSRVLQAQVTRDTLAGKLREAELALARLVGSAEVPVDALIGAFEQVPPLEPLLANLPEQPLLRQLDAERQAQESMARSLKSARMPQVSAVVSRAPVAPGVVNGYGSYAGITVNVPLFRGNSDVAAQRAAEERAGGAGERREQGEVDLKTRVRTLHEIATAALARVPEFSGLLRESDQVRRGFFEQWYQMGRRSLFELLASESEYYSLQTAHINTLYDGLATCARLRGEAGVLASWLGFSAGDQAVRERSN